MAPRSNTPPHNKSHHQAPPDKRATPQMCSIAHLRGGKGGANRALEMGYYLQPLPGNLVPTSRPEKTE